MYAYITTKGITKQNTLNRLGSCQDKKETNHQH
ncbi:hypothetical protein F383_28248 [Gossypium arboreum]|uniref:Uncharacterized protein n=1 Tax=Gossypium arboreum TaxID=29729 RepID=A0A0B0P723_GOSAR|nr:hypothetical protein F383_28248 [Gossypium arboreum]